MHGQPSGSSCRHCHLTFPSGRGRSFMVKNDGLPSCWMHLYVRWRGKELEEQHSVHAEAECRLPRPKITELLSRSNGTTADRHATFSLSMNQATPFCAGKSVICCCRLDVLEARRSEVAELGQNHEAGHLAIIVPNYQRPATSAVMPLRCTQRNCFTCISCGWLRRSWAHFSFDTGQSIPRTLHCSLDTHYRAMKA